MPDPVPVSFHSWFFSDSIQMVFGLLLVLCLSWFVVLFLLAVADVGRSVGEARRERRDHGLG